MYAHVTPEGTITEASLPDTAKRLDGGGWVSGLRTYADDATRAACGWFPVVDTPRPVDTAQATHDRSLRLANGLPTVTWTQRPWTALEQADRAAVANESTIRTQAEAALATDRAFRAITGTPTNAQILAQVRALTNQNIGIIRLLLGLLDGTD